MGKIASFIFIVAAAVGCGSSKSSGTTDAKGSGSDSGSGGSDAPTKKDAPAGGTITISGTAQAVNAGQGNGTAIVGATITPYNGGVAGSAATSGSNGAYTLTVDAGFDGYLVGHAPAGSTTYLDTYAWVPAAESANFTANINFMTNQTITTIYSNGDCGQTETNTDAIILLKVVTAAGAPVTGATVTASPTAPVCYTTPGAGAAAGEKPTKAATETDASGIAIVLNATTEWLSLMGSGGGGTYTTTALLGPVALTGTGNGINTTLVVQQ